MIDKVKNPNTTSDTTANESEAAIDLSIVTKAWIRAARAECQLNLLRNLKKSKLGVAEVEAFIDNLENAKKSKKSKLGNRDTDLLKKIMDKKVIDAEIYAMETESRKNRLRKKINKIHGKNSRPAKSILKKLRNAATKEKNEINDRHNGKEMHLKEKFVKPSKKIDIPEGLERYESLTIFDEVQNEAEDNMKKKIEYNEVEINVVGTTVDEDEYAFLILPPKYSIYKALDIEDFETAFEVCNAKIRYDRKKEEDEKCGSEEELSEEEKKVIEEIEAMSRVVYDPIEMSVNLGNRRVTDLKENCKVYLPKPLSPEEEAQLAIRKGKYMTIFKRYTEEKCGKKGEQRLNLTFSQRKGLEKLKKRIKDKEIFVILTDKTGKMAVVSRDIYEQMGENSGVSSEELGCIPFDKED